MTVTGYYPTGSVSWNFTSSGTFLSDTCTLSGTNPSTCQATLTPQNSGNVTATYGGDANNLGSAGTFQVTFVPNEYVRFTMDNSGPPATITLSGCSVFPTSVVANGMAQILHTDPGCSPITASLPPSTGGTRYVGYGGVSTFAIPGCSPSSCQNFSATVYFQLQSEYKATPFTPAAWTTPGSIPVTGTWAGKQGATICTIQFVSGGGVSSCQGWSDYNRQFSFSNFTISTSLRWSSPHSSFSVSAANQIYDANYYYQVLEGFRYSLEGSASAPSAPLLAYTAFGSSGSSMLGTSLTQLWLDSASPWSAPQILPGSSSNERWASNAISGSAAAGQNVSIPYFHQYYATLGYSVVGGPSGSSPPTAVLSLFGGPVRVVLTNQSSQAQTWADAGGGYNFTNPLVGSSSTVRWIALLASGTVSSSGSILPTYYHQYAFALGYSVVGGGRFNPPQLITASFGSSSPRNLTVSVATHWLDAGSQWAVSAQLPGSTANERWATGSHVSGTASAAVTTVFEYYHQFIANVSYQVLGGGTPGAPAYSYSSMGSVTLATLSTSPTSLWVDSGTKWSLPPLLADSASNERWIAASVTVGNATSPFSDALPYQHQYFVKVSANTAVGGSYSNSTRWYNSDAKVNLTATASVNWRFDYWDGVGTGSYNGTSASPTASVSGPINETAVFSPGIFVGSTQGGSVRYQFGSTSGTVSGGGNSTVFVPLGENLTVTAIPSSVLQVFDDWSGNLTGGRVQGSFVVGAPGSVTATFAVNYLGIGEAASIVAALVVVATVALVRRRRRSKPQREGEWQKKTWQEEMEEPEERKGKAPRKSRLLSVFGSLKAFGR